MKQLNAVARSLREDHKFGGYIHLKTIPGASDDLLSDADHNPVTRLLDTQSLESRFLAKKRQLTLFDAASTATTGEL